jgi:mannonate dehydratase
MKITAARVIVCCPGRNFVTLKVETDEGLTGLGDATLNGRELAVASYLADHVIPCLVGRDAHQIEDIWQYLYRGAYWRRGPVTMSAIAAVDTALWDLKAKAAGLPLYQLLGGKSRAAVMVYGHANGRDIEETCDAVAAYMGEGYRAIRAQSGIPGLEKVYGIGRGTTFYEPAEKGLPPETTWSTEKYLDYAPKLFEALRTRFGFEPHSCTTCTTA